MQRMAHTHTWWPVSYRDIWGRDRDILLGTVERWRCSGCGAESAGEHMPSVSEESVEQEAVETVKKQSEVSIPTIKLKVNGDWYRLSGGKEGLEKVEEDEADKKKERKGEEVRGLTDRVRLLEERMDILEKSPLEKESADLEKKKEESDEKVEDLIEKLDTAVKKGDITRKSFEAKVEELGGDQRRLQEDLLRVVEYCQEFEKSLNKVQKTNEALVRQIEDMTIEKKKLENGDTESVSPVIKAKSAFKVAPPGLGQRPPSPHLSHLPLLPPNMPPPVNPFYNYPLQNQGQPRQHIYSGGLVSFPSLPQ